MRRLKLTKRDSDASRKPMARIPTAMSVAAAFGSLGGCVQVAAPERPIEINLNINIRQEVVVRLQQDARELIQNNPGVF